MNAWSKLLALMVLLAAGYGVYRASAGGWTAWVDQRPEFPDSIDANLFRSSLVESGGVSSSSGSRALETPLVRPTSPGQSTLPGLSQLRNESREWLRGLGYDDRTERLSRE